MSSLSLSIQTGDIFDATMETYSTDGTYMLSKTYDSALEAFDAAFFSDNQTVQQLSSTSVILAYAAIGAPGTTFRVALTGSGIGPVSSLSALEAAIDAGIATGAINRIAVSQDATTILAMDLTTTGYTIGSGTDRLVVTGALPTGLAQAQDMLTLLGNSDFDHLATLSGSERTAFFDDLSAFGITGISLANANHTLLSLAVSATRMTLEVGDLNLVATGVFPTNFGALASALFDVYQTFGFGDAPIDLTQIAGLGLTGIVISTDAGQELLRVTDAEAVVRDGYVETAVVSGTDDDDLYWSSDAQVKAESLTLDLGAGNDLLLLEEYEAVFYDPDTAIPGVRHFVGGSGVDRLSIEHSFEAVSVDMAAGVVRIQSYEGDDIQVTISGFEAVQFGGYHSHASYTGTAAADSVGFWELTYAGALLNGAGGNDTLDLSHIYGVFGDGSIGMSAAEFAQDWHIYADGLGSHRLERLDSTDPDQAIVLIDFENILFGNGSGVQSTSIAALAQTSFGFAGATSFIGTSLNESFTGSRFDDSLQGGGGSDTTRAGDGNDVLGGGDGADTLYAGDGADTIEGGNGADYIGGGDTIVDRRDVIYAGAGDDFVGAGNGADLVQGGLGNDRLYGGLGIDALYGQAGNDSLDGGAGADSLFAGDGFDFLNGGGGSDRLIGGANADQFYHSGLVADGSDWAIDYFGAAGDSLVFGIAGAARGQFKISFGTAPGAGDASVQEAFITYKPTNQIIWALVDGAGQAEINLVLGGVTYDMLA